MASRSIWNGTISVGLVNVPIKVHSATEDKSVRFHEVHAKDGARIEHRKVCSKEDKEVDSKEVVKGYEVADGEYVVLEKEEIDAAAGDNARVIGVDEFVSASDIDPVYYDKTYYLGARDDEDSRSAYRLLLDALDKTGRTGLGRWTFHNREYLVAIRARDDVLALHTMRFDEELVKAKDLSVPKPSKKPAKNEVDMAGRLVENLHADFKPTKFRDTYRDTLLKYLKKKAKDGDVELPEPEERETPDDLMAALEASLSKGGK